MTTEDTPTADEHEDFLVFMARFPDRVTELGEKLHEIVTTCRDVAGHSDKTGKANLRKGRLTLAIEVTYDPEAPGGGMVAFADDVKVKLPEFDREPMSRFWVDPKTGALLDTPPDPRNQHALFDRPTSSKES
jgi:hypothetical protein